MELALRERPLLGGKSYKRDKDISKISYSDSFSLNSYFYIVFKVHCFNSIKLYQIYIFSLKLFILIFTSLTN